MLLLASAFATKVSWEVPYDLVPSAALGPSIRWATSLERVLAAPLRHPRHDQYVTETKDAGIVLVHKARARGGLWVTSVAATPDVPASDVLRVAYELVCAEAVDPGHTKRVSLFDLPAGEGPMWTIREEEVETTSPEGREEHCRALLPAWSADSKMDLSSEGLGFPAAARALSEALGHQDLPFRAAQSAVAAYSRVGFEAAAVTGVAMATSHQAKESSRLPRGVRSAPVTAVALLRGHRRSNRGLALRQGS